jgi:hypothetical protein
LNANQRQFYDAFTTKGQSTCALALLLSAVLMGVTGCGLFHKKAPPVTYDDPGIKTKVEAALKAEPLLNESRITVESQNGVVQLSGEIQSLAAKERAGLAAASVPGILQVKNDLLVHSR